MESIKNDELKDMVNLKEVDTTADNAKKLTSEADNSKEVNGVTDNAKEVIVVADNVKKLASEADNSKEMTSASNKIKTTVKTPKKHFNWFFKPFNVFVKNVLLRIIYRPKMLGVENFVTDTRAIILCNHYSAKDPFPVIGKLFGKKSKVLMKLELTNNAFLARVFDELGTIAIRRGESDIVAVKKIIALLNNDGQLLIFPEGTRNKEGSKQMLPFKEGTATFAIKTKSILVPMMYYKKPKFWHKNYLLIGKSFDLSEFYDQKNKESKELATQKLVEKMNELRVEVDTWVEKFGGNSKKYLQSKMLSNK
ncbi:MAG: lysophospholipid acyltransferase family protein [Clostridia bacterium]